MSDAAILREARAFLGVGRLASSEQVRAAWKRKLKQVHPDLGGTKEAAQHATNMRDVVLTWIEAGRPDLSARPYPDSATSGAAPFQAQNFARQQAHQARSVYPSETGWEFAGWIVFSLLCFLLGVLLPSPRSEHRWAQRYEPPFSISPYYPYHLPSCEGMDAPEETKAILDGKCWPAQFRR